MMKHLTVIEQRYEDITRFTIEVLKEGNDSLELIERMLKEEKYEELAAIKRGYETMDKVMPMPDIE